MDENQVANVIPEFCRKDFLETSAPFDWLYTRREDKFALRQYIEQMKAQAKAVKVTSFMQMWHDFLIDKAHQNGVLTSENVTAFDGQDIELLCGSYVADDQGITTIDRYGAEVVVCDHPIMPVQRLINVDSGEVKIEIAFKRKNRWAKKVIDKSVLSSSQKIVDLSKYGIGVDTENARDLVRYLSFVENANYQELPETCSVGRLGWVGDYGFSPYVEHLAFDGEASFKPAFDSVQPFGDPTKWMDAALDIRKQGTTTAKIVLAASFASVLVEPCSALPFFVHLWGGTEAGKTVALMLAASVWACPIMGRYIHTFNSTSVGQEMMAGFLNSLPLCIDELMIINDRKDFDAMIYALTEGIGRSRGAKAGGVQRLQTWRNCIITTGESPITNARSGGGAINRILDIDCKDVRIFDDPQGLVEIITQNYGFAGRRFVDALADEGTKSTVLAMQRDYYAQLIKMDTTEKQAQAASLILTANALAEDAIFHDGVLLTAKDMAPYLMTRKEVSVNERSWEWLLDWIASNSPHFEAGEPRERYGYMEDKTYPNTAFIIRSVFDRAVVDAGFNPTALLSWLASTNKIEREDGKFTKMKRIPGMNSPVRCVWVKLPAFDGQNS